MVQTPSQSALLPASQALDRTPAVLRRAGKNALFAADEFFAARISNPHTRRAYARIVGRFLAWCEEQGIELRQVTPGLAGRFIEEIPGSDPTKNLALAALRHFFDALVIRHAVGLNPFSSVRGRKHAVVDGKTPELAIQQARDLLASIDLSGVVGLRDRAVLGVLTYTGARVGALARLRRQDLEDQGAQRVLRFREKGGQQREIPVRHDLDRWLEAYLQAARIAADPKETPLFRAALGKQKKLSRNPYVGGGVAGFEGELKYNIRGARAFWSGRIDLASLDEFVAREATFLAELQDTSLWLSRSCERAETRR